MAKPQKNLLIFKVLNLISTSNGNDGRGERFTSFLNLYKDKFNLYVLDFDYDPSIVKSYYTNGPMVSYADYLKSIYPDINIIKVSVQDYISKVHQAKDFDIDYHLNLEIDFDVIFTSENFLGYTLNNLENKSQLTYRQIKILSLNNKAAFLFSIYYYGIYKLVEHSFKNYNAIKLQYITDPIDVLYEGFKKVVPDIRDSSILKTMQYDYFPANQYFYMVKNLKSYNVKKRYHFVVGNSINDPYREYLYRRYLLNIYDRYNACDDYQFLLSGYYNQSQFNNWVDHKEFYSRISESKFGIILNTYSKDTISTNKLYLYLCYNVVPFIAEGSDSRSRYLSKELLDVLEVKDGYDLYNKLRNADYDDLNQLVQQNFEKYRDISFYKTIFDKYFDV